MDRRTDASLVPAFASDRPDRSPALRYDLPADLPAILDDGTACQVLARTPVEDPAIRMVLISACDFLEGRLVRAATLARDAVRRLDDSAAPDAALVAAAVDHLGRLGIVLGDPVLLAEHRRTTAALAVDITGADTLAFPPSEPAWGESSGAWTRCAPMPPDGEPSYRRGSSNARLAAILVARGDAAHALDLADAAAADLSRTGSPREVAIAALTAADALALLGRHTEAAERSLRAELLAPKDGAVDRALADHRAWFGDPSRGLGRTPPPIPAERGDTDGEPVDPVLGDAGLEPAAILRATARSAVVAVASGSPEAGPLVRSLAMLAERLGASLWVAVAHALETLVGRGLAELPERIAPLPVTPVLGMISAAIGAHADRLDEAAWSLVGEAAIDHPERWRPLARRLLGATSRITEPRARLAAARLLVEIGEASDVALIDDATRRLGLRGKDGVLARSLARRVAPRLAIDDLGRVSIALDARSIGPVGRRKVLALLCFLLTQAELAATREQVLDALWPEQDPEVAANSLNQTIYFVRRTIEPAYRDRTSPEYLHHDPEIIWLDSELVRARSRRCRDLATRAKAGGPNAASAIDELAEAYVARFALDFSYDPWAEAYREGLHASYLAAMETAIGQAADADDLQRAIRLAERALAVDHGAEGIELLLLRLYRRAGAHAAAAEQYAHYASVLRDELGVEPPPLASL